jgi:hypothetical protein
MSSAYRNSVTVKVSDDMLAGLDGARGPVDRADWVRALIAERIASGQPAGGVDWERRAQRAEDALAGVAAALDAWLGVGGQDATSALLRAWRDRRNGSG